MVSLLFVLAALAITASASPMDEMRARGIDDLMPLNANHPAYGAAINPNLYKPINASLPAALREESSFPSSDLQRLQAGIGQPLERRLNQLPTAAEHSPVPWPADYWAVAKDSINHKWTNEPSPAEKYATAFGLNVQQFKDAISRNNGVDSQRGRRVCKKRSDCASLADGSACAIREGQTEGRCIPTWFGICHAWAPAAILEPEAKCPVTKNGVTFRPVDIKAYLSMIYDGAGLPTVFTGMRFNGNDGQVTRDANGRANDAAFRDLNPGYFHIAMTNLLGRFKTSFVVDVTAGAEVWNQPIRGYKILEQKIITAAEAAKLFNAQAYPFNANAVSFAQVRTRFSWIVESTEDGPHVTNPNKINRYTLDAAGQIIGGEWLGASMNDHPDFLWYSTRRPNLNLVTRVGLSYKNVRDLLEESIKGNC
ncbi:hypothetical protein BCR44DRAFT_1514359 [Catenaria anguillulae PL171]|uniref:Uncharacterized protein n=1 Tax=Catenaria anguillulae PL171 TaxID=765915 RepID=A0A1Y2HH88_9FUNG|nr:hypothetical protein BCR44DRAFT_1514359 [Catenaria anguillulae PL171]